MPCLASGLLLLSFAGGCGFSCMACLDAHSLDYLTRTPSKCHIWRQMIRSFRCKDTERLADNYRVRRFASVERVARRKLAQLDAAATLSFLRVPPGNRLEALRGERRGTYSIRINEQWRLCFRFSEGDAYDVEIVDYH